MTTLGERATYARLWYAQNKERLQKIARDRYATDSVHRSRRLKNNRKWRIKNPETVKIWRVANREIILGFKRRHYLKHKKRILSRNAQWFKENPEASREIKKRHKIKRRAWQFGSEYEDCSAQIALLKLASNCFWCGGVLTDKNRTIDHVIPLCRGGPHKKKNLVAACRTCNCSKNGRLPEEWR